MRGALARAVAGAERLLVYPLFMADGWFTQTHLPARLTEAGAGEVVQLAPFGLDPAVQELTVTLAREAAVAAGRAPAETEVLLAAHGSFRSRAPSAVARAMAERLAAEGGFRRVEAAFIDEQPRIAEVAAGFGPGRCACPSLLHGAGM